MSEKGDAWEEAVTPTAQPERESVSGVLHLLAFTTGASIAAALYRWIDLR